MNKQNNDFNLKKQYCKFLIIDFDIIDQNNYNRIINILSELCFNYNIINYKDVTIFIYYEDLDIDFKNLFTAINDDFNANLKIFESARIYDQKVINQICDMYLKYLHNHHYANNRHLVLSLIKNNVDMLKELKPSLLNKVSVDLSLQDVINGMMECNLNVTKTATEVYMHRNTINNKLDIIRKETGFNVQDFKDAVALYILFKI